MIVQSDIRRYHIDRRFSERNLISIHYKLVSGHPLAVPSGRATDTLWQKRADWLRHREGENNAVDARGNSSGCNSPAATTTVCKELQVIQSQAVERGQRRVLQP